MKDYRKYTVKQLLLKATKLQCKMAKLTYKEAMSVPDDISATEVLAKTTFNTAVKAKMHKAHAKVDAILTELRYRAKPIITEEVKSIVKAMEKEAKKKFRKARGD